MRIMITSGQVGPVISLDFCKDNIFCRCLGAATCILLWLKMSIIMCMFSHSRRAAGVSWEDMEVERKAIDLTKVCRGSSRQAEQSMSWQAVRNGNRNVKIVQIQNSLFKLLCHDIFKFPFFYSSNFIWPPYPRTTL